MFLLSLATYTYTKRNAYSNKSNKYVSDIKISVIKIGEF